MEPHTPIRLTVDFSHMQCQVGCVRREKKWGGEQRGGERGKCGTKDSERSRYMCGNVRVCVCISLTACEFYKCLTLLELIPIKSLQRAAVCQCLTPPLICRHPFSWMRTNSRQTAASGAEQRSCSNRYIRLHGWLSNLSSAHAKRMSERLKLRQQTQRFAFLFQALALKSKTIAVPWRRSGRYSSGSTPHLEHTLLCFMHVFCNPLQSTGPSNCHGLEINSGTSWGVF